MRRRKYVMNLGDKERNVNVNKSKGTKLSLPLFNLVVGLIHNRVKWVHVTTSWRVLRLRMEQRPPVMEGSCEFIT
jgi:hypothetical protein